MYCFSRQKCWKTMENMCWKHFVKQKTILKHFWFCFENKIEIVVSVVVCEMLFSNFLFLKCCFWTNVLKHFFEHNFWNNSFETISLERFWKTTQIEKHIMNKQNWICVDERRNFVWTEVFETYGSALTRKLLPQIPPYKIQCTLSKKRASQVH